MRAYKGGFRGAAAEDPQQPSWCHLRVSRFICSSSSSFVTPGSSLGRCVLGSFPSPGRRRRGGGAAPRTASAAAAQSWRSPGRRAGLCWGRSPGPCCSCGSGPSRPGRPCRASSSPGSRSSASCAAFTAAVRSGGAAAASEGSRDT